MSIKVLSLPFLPKSSAMNLLLATLLYSASQIFVKLSADFHFLQITFFRGWVSLLLCGVYFIYRKRGLTTKQMPTLMVRAFFGLFSVSMFFWSMQLLPLGVAVTLNYTSPILTVFFGYLILKERPVALQTYCLVTAFVGVVLISEFRTDAYLFGIGVGLISGIASAAAYTAIRKLGSHEETINPVFMFALFVSIFCGAACLFVWKNTNIEQFLYLFMVGLTVHFAQLFMTKAFASEQASNFVVIYYFGSVIAVLIGWGVFGETLSLITLVGIAIVILSALVSKRARIAKG